MKNIQPVKIWYNGKENNANIFSLISIQDNLETSAIFYYKLYNNEFNTLSDGNLEMNGIDYENWGNQSGIGINEWAYQWAANKLNLILI